MRHHHSGLRLFLLRRLLPLFALAAVFVLSELASGQQQPGVPMPQPRLFTVQPCGGKAGATVELTITGPDAEDPQGLLFSHQGFKAELIAAAKPATPDPKKPPAKPGMQVLSSKFRVTIPASTPLGNHDVRIFNKWGISNPRAFVVGDLNEEMEKEPNNDIPEANRVALNTTVHGTIGAPTDVDYFVVALKKGDHVVVSCRSSSIDSRLPAALQLYSAGGVPLAFNRQYDGSDALLDHKATEDGDYLIRLFSFTYTQGGAEFFYRLTISTTPWIDAIFPPVVEPGKPAKVTVYGRNLPGGQLDPAAMLDNRPLEKAVVTITPPKDPGGLQRLAYTGHVQPSATALDGFEHRLRNAAGASNPYLLTYAQAPVVLDNGDNDDPEKAQPVPAPCEIAGWIEKRRDRDWYVFTAKKGDVYSIEAYADRLGSPMDLYLTLRRGDGKGTLGEYDDNPEILGPIQFFTRTDDPARQRFVVPEDGKYQLMVSSREASIQAGPRHLYRVRLTPERPDFRLVAMPASVNSPDACLVQQDGKAYFTVFVWRLDGFDGAITLTAEGLPPGVTCAPQTIGPGLKQAALVLTAAENAATWSGTIKVVGTAKVGGLAVTRDARAATITWPTPQQQNIVTLSRMDRSLVLGVREKAPYSLSAAIEKVAVQAGEKVTIPLKIKRIWADSKGPIQLTALNLPPTIVLTTGNQPVNLPGGKDEASVTLDVRPNAVPGTYTIVFRGQMVIPFSKDPMAKQKLVNTALVQPCTPVLVTVLPKQVATVAVTPAKPTVKIGAQTEVVVKVTRMFDYAGPFKVELVLPPNLKGLSAGTATIPAGQDEVKLLLKADGNAAPGNRPGLTVRATASFSEKLALTHEAKLSVDVVK